MDAKEVVEKILSDARAEAEKISTEANSTRAAQQAELDKELAAYHNKTAELAEAAAQDKRARLLASARMEISKANLAKKRELLDEVFATAQERIKNLSNGEYLDLMSKLMVKAVETGEEEVIVDEQDNRIDQSFIKTVNRQLGSGYKGNLRLSETRANLGGGFVLKRGKIRINVTLPVLIADARQSLETELANELFGS